MHCFAQTNIQLFNQLYRDGYSSTDLQHISNIYNQATKLFTGRFRPSGKTFIAHLVGTASILGSLRAPITIVAAGLLHAAYEYGDFGDGKGRGISSFRRNQLSQGVGQEIEKYVSRYLALSWNEQTIPAIYDRFDLLDSIDRDVLLIRLANELEECLDLGILYCGNLKQKQYSNHAKHLIIEMAIRLRQSTLGAELEKAFKETESFDFSTKIFDSSNRNSSFLLIPQSCQKRLFVMLNECFGTRHLFFKVVKSLYWNTKKLLKPVLPFNQK